LHSFSFKDTKTYQKKLKKIEIKLYCLQADKSSITAYSKYNDLQIRINMKRKISCQTYIKSKSNNSFSFFMIIYVFFVAGLSINEFLDFDKDHNVTLTGAG